MRISVANLLYVISIAIIRVYFSNFEYSTYPLTEFILILDIVKVDIRKRESKC